MHDFAILTQSSCELPQERARELDLLVVPVPMSINGQQYKHYLDGRDISNEAFYVQLRDKASIKTSTPSPADFIALAEPALQQGQDLLYLGLSSTLSDTYQSGVIAMKELAQRYPQRTIVYLDTLCGAMGEALLVEMAAKARKEGKDIHQTAALIEQNKTKVLHYFTLDQLEYLSRSGRLPSYQAKLGDILNIKPILSLDSAGHFQIAAKVRTYNKAISRLYDKVLGRAMELKNQVVYISHADVRKAAEQLAQKIRQAGAKELVINLLGPAIASHFGIGGIGVAFLSQSR